MAKHINFGDAINDAERWAFELLTKEQPADYVLLTNIEIPTQSGQNMEIDALIIGQWGVYVVDVKGYIGHLDAGMHAWSLDGRNVDNSLSKANYVARVLAGKLKHKIPVGVYAPWCQGMVFVTGRKGKEIMLEKQDGSLSIYTPQQIVSALTKEWGLTAPRAHEVTEQQKEYVLDTIGQVAVVEKRNNRIHDFVKQKCLFLQKGLEVWQAEYNPGDWSAPWLLKILTPSGFEDEELHHLYENQLRDEFHRLQNLSGCSGVPHCAPLIQDGERLILPIRMPRGLPMSSFKPQDHTTYQLMEALRHSTMALQSIHRRGVTVGGWTENCVFITDDGDAEFIDIRDNLTENDDTIAYAQCFLSLAERTRQPRIYHWYQSAVQGRHLDLDGLRSDLSAILELGLCDEDQAVTDIDIGSIIDHHYRLMQPITQTQTSALWLAKHIQGQFDCGLSIYKNVKQHWPELSRTYRSLSRLYHPNIERVLSFGQLPASDDLFIARSWIKGCSIDELEGYETGQPRMWIAQILTGLQYLHRLGLFHGAICPRNIICNPVRAVLVNFGVGEDIAAESYSRQYADPNLWAEEPPAEKDLYGLAASFIDVFSPLQQEGNRSSKQIMEALEAIDPQLVGEHLWSTCRDILQFKFTIEPNKSYINQFGLNDWL